MIRPLLTVVVLGVPGTAGSKSGMPIYKGKGADRVFTGKVAVIESKSKTKTSWRQGVVESARAAIACDCGDPDGCIGTLPGYPIDDALIGSMVFTVPRPASARPGDRPSKRPDLLKYGRATEDALKDAGVFTDDARIVEYGRFAKTYPGEDPDALDVPGALIVLWRASQLPLWRPPSDETAPPISTLVPRPRQGTLF